MPHIELQLLSSVLRQLWLVPHRCPAAVLQELSCWGLHATATGARSLFVPDPAFCCAQLAAPAKSESATTTAKPTGRTASSILASAVTALRCRVLALRRQPNNRPILDGRDRFSMEWAGYSMERRSR